MPTFNVKHKNPIRTISILAIIFVIGLSQSAPCKTPPDAFLNAIASQNPRSDNYLTLRDLINVLEPGKWQYVEEWQWMYRVTSQDKRSNKKQEYAYLFVVDSSKDDMEFGRGKRIVYLQRISVDGTELPNTQLVSESAILIQKAWEKHPNYALEIENKRKWEENEAKKAFNRHKLRNWKWK